MGIWCTTLILLLYQDNCGVQSSKLFSLSFLSGKPRQVIPEN